MDKSFSKRLAKIIPENGGFDLNFGLTSAPQGKLGSTVSLVIFGQATDGKSPQIIKKISVPAFAESLSDANQQALEDALTLLGV